MSQNQRDRIKVGDKVIYRDILAEVESIEETIYGDATLLLVSVDDPELTCTALKMECQIYDEEIYNPDVNDEAIKDARFNSRMTMKMVDNLTDKHFRDGNH